MELRISRRNRRRSDTRQRRDTSLGTFLDDVPREIGVLLLRSAPKRQPWAIAGPPGF